MKVFVSYASEDTTHARLLVDALKRRGIEVLEDAAIAAGASFATELHRMMEEADAFVLLISKSSTASPWVDREVATAATRATRDRRIRLMPVVLDKRAEIPPLLSRYQYIRFDNARDANRVADLILGGLSAAVSPPDLNLEREIVESERAGLDREIAKRGREMTGSLAGLVRVVSIVGLAAGLAATTLVVWVSAGTHSASAGVLTAVSLLSASLSATVGFYYRRSRDGH
jgi:hypothetical protein